MSARASDRPLVTFVVPVLDEEGCVEELVKRVRSAWEDAGVAGELLFVDDGSRDRTAERIEAARAAHPDVTAIFLTRTFGHQAALAAGLRFARGDCVVTLDGDLQHPPERIPAMIAAWRRGSDVVHMRRRDPGGATNRWKARASDLFYAFLKRLSGTRVLPSGADFRLLDRRVVDALNELEERFPFFRGLVPWLGYRETVLDYDVQPRFAGRSKYRLRPMLRLASDGIVAFSILPLRLIGLVGALTTALGIVFGSFALLAHITGRVEASGWTSLVVLVLVFGGVQLLSLGVVSEYVGRIYEEVKRRPRYVIERKEGFE